MCPSLAAFILVSLIQAAAAAIEVGDEIGPYTVTRILPRPTSIGDLEYADGALWILGAYHADIYQLDPISGQTLAIYSVPGDSLHDEQPYPVPTGLAYDGSTWFASIRVPDYLASLTLNQPPDVTLNWTADLPFTPQDLAFADGSLFCPEYEGPIHRLDPASGSLVGTFPAPSGYIYGLAFDGTNLIAAYGVGGPPRTFWLIDPNDGSIVDTWTMPDWTNLITGLAYDVPTRSLYVGAAAGIVVAQLPTVGTEPMTWGTLKGAYR